MVLYSKTIRMTRDHRGRCLIAKSTETDTTGQM